MNLNLLQEEISLLLAVSQVPLSDDSTEHACAVFRLWRSHQSRLRPFWTIVIPPGTLWCVSKVSQKQLSILLRGEYVPSLFFLTEVALRCAEKEEVFYFCKKLDTGECGQFSK